MPEQNQTNDPNDKPQARPANQPQAQSQSQSQSQPSGKLGLNSDNQPDLVAPSGVNERDRGAADDPVSAGGTVNFDDFDNEHPRGNTSRTGGTWSDRPSDSGAVGPAPNAGLSNRNGPSDPDNKRDLDRS